MEDDDENCHEDVAPRSAVAEEVARLKKVAFAAMEKRGRLPQPMFWSAFGYAVSRLRTKKEKARMLKDIFEG